jgi:hypothetical protein
MIEVLEFFVDFQIKSYGLKKRKIQWFQRRPQLRIQQSQ